MKFKVGDKVIYTETSEVIGSNNPTRSKTILEYEGIVTGITSGFERNFGEYQIKYFDNATHKMMNLIVHRSQLSLNKWCNRINFF